MKSMLHEASSVTKAVQKAWENSGKPREFTINVLELGETNFFGFSKRPAIVSITFDPRNLASQGKNDRRDQSRPQRHPHSGREDEQRRDQRNQRPDRNATDQRQQRTTDRPLRADQPQRQQQPQDANMRDMQREQKPREQYVSREQQGLRDGREQSAGGFDMDELAVWTPELSADLQSDTAALVTNAQIGIPYTVTFDKRNAVVAFASPVFPEQDLERQLFMSMSYLLIQFLKKKHKKKLRGFHITVTSNRQNGASQSSAPTE